MPTTASPSTLHPRRQAAILAATLAGIAVLVLASLALGSVRLALADVGAVLTGRAPAQAAAEAIVLQFRLPRAVTAILVGAGLGASGLMMQTLFRNPLAGPFVLGINAGASLGVALVVLAATSVGWAGAVAGLGAWALVGAATLGAGLVLLLVAIVAVWIQDSTTLLILGLMFSSATGALVGILQYFSEAERIQAFLIWTFGDLGGVTWAQLQVLVPVVVVGLLGAGLLVKPLNALLLGEAYARSLGERVGAVRMGIIVSTSLLAGGITAFCGPIAFLGLAVPHLVRALFGTADHRVLMPYVMLLGAALALACDLLAQVPGAAVTLPLNAVTSLFGAPVVIWVVLQRRNLGRAF